MERPGRWHRPVPRELGEQARATFWTWETFLSSLFSGILREFPEGQFEDLGHGNDSRLPLFSTLSQAHVCSRNTPLFTRLPPRTTRSLFFKLLNVSHRKERHLISLPSTHTHTQKAKKHTCPPQPHFYIYRCACAHMHIHTYQLRSGCCPTHCRVCLLI